MTKEEFMKERSQDDVTSQIRDIAEYMSLCGKTEKAIVKLATCEEFDVLDETFIGFFNKATGLFDISFDDVLLMHELKNDDRYIRIENFINAGFDLMVTFEKDEKIEFWHNVLEPIVIKKREYISGKKRKYKNLLFHKIEK